MNSPIGVPHVSDGDIVQRVLRGDATAWTTLVHAHQDAVFRLAYLLLGDSSDAEDVAQDTFLRAYRALPRFDAAKPLRPWLLQIARRLAYNRQRSLRRYLAALRRYASTQTPYVWQGTNPTTVADALALRAAVGRLARPDQEIIYLRYYLDLSVEETATVLDVAPGTVKSRLHRALTRLRDEMVLAEQP